MPTDMNAVGNLNVIKWECEICKTIFDIRKYQGGTCPNCYQEYLHDNGCYRIELTIGQKNILRSLREEKSDH